MKKRGTSQIDWIMSLALFLLYIGWFFAFVTPSIKFDSNKDSFMILLKNDFKNEFNWELQRYPLFIEYNQTTSSKPIIIDYNFDSTEIKFLDETDYIIWNNKLIFLANISPNIKTYWILQGIEHDNSYNYYGLNVKNNWASTENFSVSFNQGLIESIVYQEETKIQDIDYEINEVNLNPTNYSYTDFGFVAVYVSTTDNINHTSFIFANNNEVHNFITLENPESTYTFTIEMELDNYPSYYSTNLYYGNIDYSNESQYVNYTHDSVTFYSSNEGFSIFFEDDVEFNITYYNSSLNVEINIPFTGNYEYTYFFHDGNVSSISRTDYNTKFGVFETLEGVNLENITTDYDYLKNKWNFPKDFNILVYENTSAYSYLQDAKYEIGTFNPNKRNVYAQTEDVVALNNDGSYSPIHVNYRIW